MSNPDENTDGVLLQLSDSGGFYYDNSEAQGFFYINMEWSDVFKNDAKKLSHHERSTWVGERPHFVFLRIKKKVYTQLCEHV